MAYDEFFTDQDKPYAENLNDSLLLLDAFDVTVPLEMPGMFSNGDFSNSVNTPRKCGVGIVTLKSVDSGVTVGTDSISGTGDVVFRIYPNFNSFYKWQSIVLEKTGDVEISFKKIDGTGISATINSEGVISEASALKELQEIDVCFSLDEAEITNILICFVNNQTVHTRVNALLEADQLVNVNGTVTNGDSKAVSGDTVYNAIDSLSDTVDGKLDLKEDLSNKVSTLNTSTTNYPTCKAVKDKLDLKSDTGHTHTISNVTNLQSTLNNKASSTHTHLKADVTDLYKYEISSSEYNPTIDSTITIYVNVTDGNNEGVANHTFTMKTKNGDVSLTTDSNGQATHSYTCDTWGNQRFRVNGYSMYLNVTGWRTITHTNYKLFINGAERLCEIRYYRPGTSIGTSWTLVETITDSDYVPAPQQDSVYCASNIRGLIVRIFSSGSIQAQATTATSDQLFSFHAMWHY